MEMEEAELDSAKALAVIGAPKSSAAASFSFYPKDAPMAFGTMPTRYLLKLFF
jgi:hypothetical protein